MPQVTRVFGFLAALLSALILVQLASCGKLHGMRPLAPDGSAMTMPSVLAELDAAQPPEGVDTAVWLELKAALRAQLDAQGGKAVADAPKGAANLIPDFVVNDNGDGTSTFSWSYYNVGDYDQNGKASIADITPIAIHYLQLVADHPEAEPVDGNGDGIINVADITPLAMNFQSEVFQYRIEGTDMPGGAWGDVGYVLFSDAISSNRKKYEVVFEHFANIYFRITPLDFEGNPGVTSMENQVMAVDLQVSPGTAGPAEVVNVQASTLDKAGALMYSSFMQIYYAVSPKRSETMSQTPISTQARIVELHDNGDGTYSTTFYSQAAGDFVFSLIVIDTRMEDKTSLTDNATLAISPGPVAGLKINEEFTGSPCSGPIYFYATDANGNVIPNPDPSEYVVYSDNPDIVTSDVMVYPDDTALLYATVTANNWGTSILETEHIPSGAGADKVTYGYYPWFNWVRPQEDPLMPQVPSPLAKQIKGMYGGTPSLAEHFEVVGDIRVPPMVGDGWQSFMLKMAFPDTGDLALDDVVSQLPNVEVTYTVNTSAGWNYVNISGNTTDGSEYTGEQAVYALQFSTAGGGVPSETFLPIGVVGTTMILNNDAAFPIYIDDGSWFGYYDIEFSLKPVKHLNMRVYRLQGLVTDAQIVEDVNKAQETFNVNALLCSMEFFVEFQATITEIPAADWNKIDVDGDGLDRYDRNGDGDYTDAGDNNDLANAMGLGYYDGAAATENIYYVPDIRGGAMGTTYWPNGQVAVKNSVDTDNLTLAHEKVHEMDLRKDGDFDVKDGADMDATKAGIQKDATAESQGAYNDDNLMNYAKTGQWIGHEQGRELDP